MIETAISNLILSLPEYFLEPKTVDEFRILSDSFFNPNYKKPVYFS